MAKYLIIFGTFATVSYLVTSNIINLSTDTNAIPHELVRIRTVLSLISIIAGGAAWKYVFDKP